MNAEHSVPLTKVCPRCLHNMELVSEEPYAMNQPIRRWQCTCGFWQALYGSKEEGEA